MVWVCPNPPKLGVALLEVPPNTLEGAVALLRPPKAGAGACAPFWLSAPNPKAGLPGVAGLLPPKAGIALLLKLNPGAAFAAAPKAPG